MAGRIVARASAREALPSGSWVRLRVETGGEALSLWVDGDERALSMACTSQGARPDDDWRSIAETFEVLPSVLTFEFIPEE